MLENIVSIYDNKQELMHHLKKKNYEKNMKEFRNSYNKYFFEMTDYVGAAENKEAAAKEKQRLKEEEAAKKAAEKAAAAKEKKMKIRKHVLV